MSASTTRYRTAHRPDPIALRGHGRHSVGVTCPTAHRDNAVSSTLEQIDFGGTSLSAGSRPVWRGPHAERVRRRTRSGRSPSLLGIEGATPSASSLATLRVHAHAGARSTDSDPRANTPWANSATTSPSVGVSTTSARVAASATCVVVSRPDPMCPVDHAPALDVSTANGVLLALRARALWRQPRNVSGRRARTGTRDQRRVIGDVVPGFLTADFSAWMREMITAETELARRAAEHTRSGKRAGGPGWPSTATLVSVRGRGPTTSNRSDVAGRRAAVCAATSTACV